MAFFLGGGYGMRFPVIETEQPKPVMMPAPPLNIYVLVAFHVIQKHWTVIRKTGLDEYETIEGAQEAASKLPACWANVHVVNIRIA